ncbi:MAG: YlxR family protein [Proteobacteria bacterium]|nr:YlxR family protein [Pseudomonadota bacterium]MBU1737626.1 YlxR family protein [Pseudomonadota bacterium]
MQTQTESDQGGATPIRTCFGCRIRKNPADLLRFTVAGSSGVLQLDGVKKSAGRGVYCCNDTGCLGRLVRNRKGLKRALRVTELDMVEIENLF